MLRSRPLLVVFACASWGMACNSILGLNDYRTAPEAGTNPGTDSGSCEWDPDSGQCYPCKPQQDLQYLNACTSATCVAFDDKTRVTKLPADGALPPVPELPAEDAEAEPSAEPAPEASVEAGSEAGKEGGVDAGVEAGAEASVEAGADAGNPLPVCGTKANGPIVWVTGTAKLYLAALARTLFTDTNPITIIWRGNSSCEAMAATLDGTGLNENGAYWDKSQTPDEVACQMPTGDLVHADMSISDVFPSTCRALPNGLPADVGEYLGPVQTMTFIVPKASQERSISATAAYFVYGFGAESGVAPWTNADNIIRLDNASGTQRILAAGIGVPAEKWKGANLDHSALLISRLTSPPEGTAASTIGILAATNISGTVAPQINVLAFKHYGQSCAYYPDSTASSKDKHNVRDGHYSLWAPVHIFTKIDSKGYPLNENVTRVINYLTGATPPPGGLDLIEVAALNNLVPNCAMKVKRDKEMGALAPFAPQNPCNCYFEKVATGATTCAPCTIKSECPSATDICSFGYCESP